GSAGEGFLLFPSAAPPFLLPSARSRSRGILCSCTPDRFAERAPKRTRPRLRTARRREKERTFPTSGFSSALFCFRTFDSQTPKMIDPPKTSSTQNTDTKADAAFLRKSFEDAGQEQVFRFWEELTGEERKSLLAEASEIDLEELGQLTRGNGEESLQADDLNLAPAPFLALPR